MIEKLADLFEIALKTISEATYTVFLNILTPFLVPSINLYLVIIGFKIILGDLDTSKKSLIRLFVLFPIVMAIVMDYATYKEYVMNPIMIIRGYVMNEILNIADSTGENTFANLDIIFKQILFIVKDSFEFSMYNIKVLDLILTVVLILGLGILYIAIAYFFMVSLVAPSLFLMGGAITLALYGFDRTKHITESWFRTTITYLLYGPIGSVLMIFTYQIMKVTTAQIKNDFDGMFFTIFATIVLLSFVKMIPV